MNWSIEEVKSWLANTLQLDEQVVKIFEGKKIKKKMYTWHIHYVYIILYTYFSELLLIIYIFFRMFRK